MTNYVYWVHLEDQAIETCGYVGVTVNITRRWQEHKLSKRKSHFTSAIASYGDKLIWEIVYTGPMAECYALERKLLQKPNVGWNVAIGGAVSCNLGRPLAEETKKKISNTYKGNVGWCSSKTGISSQEALEKNTCT